MCFVFAKIAIYYLKPNYYSKKFIELALLMLNVL